MCYTCCTMLTHDTPNTRAARNAAYATLTKNYTIYRAGDTIVDWKGNTYTVTHTHISGDTLKIVAVDNLDIIHTFAHEHIQKVC